MPPPQPNSSSVAIAILAEAPVPGAAKPRLIPLLGAHAAATLQERLTERAVATAIAANTGPLTLWCSPDATHESFLKLVTRLPITLKTQVKGDRGARIFAAAASAGGPVIVIGTDCPALTHVHIRAAATALQEGTEIILIPAEDSDYVLIGMQKPDAALFSNMPWGTGKVITETRARS
ncbi:MAG TPA: TIGR04282 family arsenosugar biosynthesis glycosyltransferase [Pseudolabrys sp.]|nr:TIGR04282 family arsenosugar biosynthesis glycosyltransferase [Pseudolabrys sp.]